MSFSVLNSPRRSSNSFRKLVGVFFKQPGSPFAGVPTSQMFEEVFRKHRGLFGSGAIYNTATVLWLFWGSCCKTARWPPARQRSSAKLVDGFTLTMPDTLRNQKQYPQVNTQKPGIGFPVARCVAVLSLATACVLDLAIGPYAGK